jgi:ParB family chromosome partitioning protein
LGRLDTVTVTICLDLRPLSRPIAELWAWQGNYRQGDVGAVSLSLDRFGQTKPVVARHFGDRLTVIAGNHTLEAARQLGWNHLAVVVRDDLNEEEAIAYAIADNRTSDLATNNEAVLGQLLARLAHNDDLLIATGFDGDDIDDLHEDPLPPLPPDEPKLCPHCGEEL